MFELKVERFILCYEVPRVFIKCQGCCYCRVFVSCGRGVLLLQCVAEHTACLLPGLGLLSWLGKKLNNIVCELCSLPGAITVGGSISHTLV